MNAANMQKYGLLAMRITVGWYFLYAGFSKIIAENWSAAKYLQGATSLSGFYGWLAGPTMLPIVNFVNEWGLLLIGLSILTGVLVKWSAPLGAAMMILYYFPVLDFPTAGHGFIVDEHLIYAAVLVFLAGHYHENPAWFKKLISKS